jgi:hypothetical protein
MYREKFVTLLHGDFRAENINRNDLNVRIATIRKYKSYHLTKR